MKLHKTPVWLAAVALLALSACTTPRTLGYLNDMEYGVDYPVMPAPELRVQVEDRLNIQVQSEYPELSTPLNTELAISDYLKQTAQLPTRSYIVDNNGCIDFPVLGSLYVEGMTIKEVEKMIAAGITDIGYIKQPLVNVTLENFTVMVIGEAHSMMVRSEEKSFNLLQAVTQFGGANRESINMKEVTVIRTEYGMRRAYSVNLKTREMFDSPVFYLQQNDIIYVKHKGSHISQGARNVTGTLRFLMGLGSLAMNILTYMVLTK